MQTLVGVFRLSFVGLQHRLCVLFLARKRSALLASVGHALQMRYCLARSGAETVLDYVIFSETEQLAKHEQQKSSKGHGKDR
jgi:hypothetical protein